MWQLAMQQAAQSNGIRTTWVDLGYDWNSLIRVDSEGDHEWTKSIADQPPAAIILGVDQANFPQVAATVFKLRESCKRWPNAVERTDQIAQRTTFIIAWFPEADREAIRILQELGVDLVLHNPTRLRPALANVARFGYCSHSTT